MSELGNRLKTARSDKGLSLDDLQEITKIQKRYLIAIEQGNYNVVPGNFYVRAFIKQYAEAVGLSPEVLFDEHRNEIPSVYEADNTEQLSRTKSRKVVSNRSSKIFDVLPKIIAALFVIGIIIAFWYIIQQNLIGNNNTTPVDKQPNDEIGFEQGGNPVNNKGNNNEGNNDGNNDGNQKEEEQNNEQKEEEPTKPEQELTVIETKGSDTTYELKYAEKFEVEIKSTEGGRSWVRAVNSDGEELVRGEINDENPQILNLDGQESIWIRVGRAKELEIIVNGVKLEYALDPTKVNVQNITINFIKDVQ